MSKIDLQPDRIKKILSFPSGTIVMSDPCYGPETWCASELKVNPDYEFEPWVRYSDEEDWGIRLAELALVRVGNSPRWGEGIEVAELGVDSGQCGFCDWAIFPDVHEVHYEHICDATVKMDVAVSRKYSYVFTRSGIGDGLYPCFALYGDHKDDLVQLSIVYLGEED